MPSSPVTRLMAIIAVAAAASAWASDLDDRLNQRLRGAWAVLEVEGYSACAGTYSDNVVGAAGVASKAPHRFEPGELVKIDKVNVKRQRVDLMLTLGVALRTSSFDGPFELFDERSCQIQLIVPVERAQVKSGDEAALASRLEELVTPYPSRDDATASDSWNGRVVEPLPADYDETLRRHARWQAEQTNAAVDAAIIRAQSDAAEVADDLRDDAEYLEGFSEGALEMASFSTTSCSSLLGASLEYYDSSPPPDSSKAWRAGWRDGQELIFNVLLAQRLNGCRVPVPPGP